MMSVHGIGDDLPVEAAIRSGQTVTGCKLEKSAHGFAGCDKYRNEVYYAAMVRLKFADKRLLLTSDVTPQTADN